MIKLRPHHLLCILGWRQSGYSEGFTDNFNRVVAELRAAGEFEPVMGVDAICIACPHNDKGICRRAAGARPDILDERVRARLRIEPGHIYDFNSLTAEIKAKIAPSDLNSICAGCNWLARGWCRAGLAATRGADSS